MAEKNAQWGRMQGGKGDSTAKRHDKKPSPAARKPFRDDEF
jgi:hypothetical protein